MDLFWNSFFLKGQRFIATKEQKFLLYTIVILSEVEGFWKQNSNIPENAKFEIQI